MGIYKNENGIIDVVLGEKNVSVFTSVADGIPTLILSDFTEEMKKDVGFPFAFKGQFITDLPHVRLSFAKIDDIDNVIGVLTELSNGIRLEKEYEEKGLENESIKQLSYIARMISLFSDIEYNGTTVVDAETFINDNILKFDTNEMVFPEELETRFRMNTLISMFKRLQDSITEHREDVALCFEDEDKEVVSEGLVELITLSSGVDKDSVSEVLLALSALNKEIKELL